MLVGVFVGVLVAEAANHRVLFPESIEFAGLIVVDWTLIPSLTFNLEVEVEPCGSTDHVDPSELDLKKSRFMLPPCNVRVPRMVWVVPAVNVRV